MGRDEYMKYIDLFLPWGQIIWEKAKNHQIFDLGKISIWVITSVASPKRKGISTAVNQPIYPIIECPACSTPNPIMTDERPFRLPCNGCGRVLKIVD